MGEPGNEGEALAGRTADGRFATGRVRSERERDGVRRADAARTAAGIPSAQGAALSAANARRRAAQAAELETVIEADAQGGRWTTARRLAFLDTLATTGNVTVATRGVGLNARGAYALRTKDVVFARGWAAARESFNDVTYARAVEIALTGLDEEVTTKDGVRTTRKHSDKLLAQILAKQGGVAPVDAKEAVAAATREPGKAGEEARLWIEAQLAKIADQLEGSGR